MRIRTRMMPWGLLVLVAAAISGCSKADEEVVVYSARTEQLVQPLFDAFTKDTGIPVRYITDSAEPLLERLKAEGEQTPADVLITVDAGNLWHAAESGVLQSLDSATLTARVPDYYRDEQGRWFGLSVRARTMVYATDRVRPDALSTYEALAEPQWQGRLCLRTSNKVYNQSLVAMMIARHGEEKAEQIVNGWVNNLARAPLSNDTKVMESILAGECDVGIVNTYYFGRLIKDAPDSALAIFWPNQGAGGVHVNLSGGGVTKHAKHPEAAKRLLEWLVADDAQAIFASLNMEYPVVANAKWDPLVEGWGRFEGDQQPLSKAGEFQRRAVMLMDRAGYE